jgi:arsenate reductase (glutaredoxin)
MPRRPVHAAALPTSTADRPQIEDVLRRLGLEPWDIARLGEPVAIGLGLATWPREETDRTRWIDALAAHPILIQRPIITADDGTAVVGRSPDRSDLS